MENDFGHWESDIKEIPINAEYFVYKITELSTGKFYIGCKQMLKKRTRPPLKNKKRKRIDYIESDWKTYTSSSGVIKEDIDNNKENYKFEILSFHKTKSEMKIEETRLIIENIYNPLCYNECVNIRCRVNKSINK